MVDLSPSGPTQSDILEADAKMDYFSFSFDGRESLGILPSDFEKNRSSSLDPKASNNSFICTNSFFSQANSNQNNANHTLSNQLCTNGITIDDDIFPISMQDDRESLGILPSDFENGSPFLNMTGKESISYKKFLQCDDDPGRESLGIMNLDNVDLNLRIGCEKSLDDYNMKQLDTTFLFPITKHFGSHNSEISSFNNSLEYPSRIYNLPSNEFSNYDHSCRQSLLNNARFLTSSPSNFRSRFFSHPIRTTDKLEIDDICGIRKQTKSMTDNVVCKIINLTRDEKDSNNSVFIEEDRVENIADVFLLNDAPECGLLDCTPQPDWPDLDESEKEKKEIPKINTEVVFKTIEKLFPETVPSESEAKLKFRTDSISSKCRNAKEMLQNLSEIFNYSHRSDEQKSEGRKILNSLVDILNNSQRIQDLEDSGNSSILEIESSAKDTSDYGEVFDVKVETKKDPEKEDHRGSDSSHKKRLSLSSYPTEISHQKTDKSNFPTSNIKKMRSQSISSVESIGKQSAFPQTKLKLKPFNIGKTKGPMKAIIPVEDMKRLQIRTVTPELPNRRSSVLQSKKTSTPLNTPRLKPLAASTPSVVVTSSEPSKTVLQKSRTARVDSKAPDVVKVDTKKFDKPNASGIRRASISVPKEALRTNKSVLSKVQSKPIRRNSISEGMLANQQSTNKSTTKSQMPLKRTRKLGVSNEIEESERKLKRSNSLGKETGMMSSLRRVRENLLKSPYCNNKNGILSENNIKIGANADKKVTFSENRDTVELKKNKENVHP